MINEIHFKQNLRNKLYKHHFFCNEVREKYQMQIIIPEGKSRTLADAIAFHIVLSLLV